MKGMIKWIGMVLCLVMGTHLQAQGVVITEHGRVADMMRTYKSINQSSDHTQAWRIQVITTDDRRKMERAQAKFRGLYPRIKTSWKHVSPWYHLKAGAYKTKLELQGFLIQVKRDFPGAIPIIDQVNKEELLSP